MTNITIVRPMTTLQNLRRLRFSLRKMMIPHTNSNIEIHIAVVLVTTASLVLASERTFINGWPSIVIADPSLSVNGCIVYVGSKCSLGLIPFKGVETNVFIISKPAMILVLCSVTAFTKYHLGP